MGRNTGKLLKVAHNRDDALAIYQVKRAVRAFGGRAAFLFSLDTLLFAQAASPALVPARAYGSSLTFTNLVPVTLHKFLTRNAYPRSLRLSVFPAELLRKLLRLLFIPLPRFTAMGASQRGHSSSSWS
jgi:hypothetical protein